MLELCQLGWDSTAYLGHNLFWTGHKRQRKHGVGIAISKSPDIVIVNIAHQSKRMMAAGIIVHGCKILVISAYTMTEKMMSLEKRNSTED